MAFQMLLIYLICGAAFALLVIVWALGTRQFGEQDRARFLPLRDLSAEELRQPVERRVPPSVALIFVILAAGVGAVLHLLTRLIAVG